MGLVVILTWVAVAPGALAPCDHTIPGCVLHGDLQYQSTGGATFETDDLFVVVEVVVVDGFLSGDGAVMALPGQDGYVVFFGTFLESGGDEERTVNLTIVLEEDIAQLGWTDRSAVTGEVTGQPGDTLASGFSFTIPLEAELGRVTVPFTFQASEGAVEDAVWFEIVADPLGPVDGTNGTPLPALLGAVGLVLAAVAARARRS